MSNSASGSDRRLRSVAVACAIAAAAMTWATAPSQAAIVQFSSTIDAAQETPPNGSTATGSGTMTMDTDANTLTINVTFSGLGSPELFSHIHGFAGPGVPAGQENRLFERFYRADTSRNRASGGSGLGLAIVAAIVGAHQGHVAVRPTDGGGLTVRVELPLAA